MSAPAAVRVPGRQGTPEWLDNRRDVVGSSDIPVITGQSPFRSTSIVDLWAVKTRQLDDDEPTADDESEERREDSERYWFGHALEEPIAKRYELVTHRRLRRENDQLRHRTMPWVGASLDRVVVGAHRIVELKWVPRGGWARGETEAVPGHVQDQIQWQLLVKGWTEADVAVLDGDRLRIEHVPADPAYQEDLVFLAHEKLWRYVQSGDMPPVDGSEATRKALVRLAERRQLVNGQHIDARRMPDLMEMAQDWHRWRRERQAAEKAEAEVKNSLSAVMLAAEATGVDCIGWRIDWHQQADTERDVTDWEVVAGALRSIVVSAENHLTTRVLIDEHGLPGDPNEAVDELIARHTKRTVVRHGARPMNLYVKKEEAGRWQ